MSTPTYPFAALVGLDTLKLALELSSIDPRLSVLIRGDKGAGKSTAARGLAALLPTGAPFVNLPIGATEDRLLGGLDVERTLQGEPTLKAGLLASANGGVLYVDEVNLLADHLADALLDAAAGGLLVVEREGFSVSQPADFVLLGSMNPEEGSLRPQLLDRFALVVDVSAPADPGIRAEVLGRRLAFDADRGAFLATWRDAQTTLSAQLTDSRLRLPEIATPPTLLHYIARRITEHGVRSLRADLAVVRASRAYAALLGAQTATEAHVDTVLPLALAHRLPAGQRPPSPPPSPPLDGKEPETETQSENQPTRESGQERLFEPLASPAPRLVIGNDTARTGAGARQERVAAGQAIGSRRTGQPQELDLRASIVHAIGVTGSTQLRSADLHERVRKGGVSTRFILVVDASGSHAVQERMRLVKGVASGLLEASHGRHDEVVVISCRGVKADVVLEPTSSRHDAERALEYLPTGGRTPLAHGLELAAGYVTDHSLLIVITDGRANVPSRGSDAWQDVRQAAQTLRCAALIVDTEDARSATGRPRELAELLRGRHVALQELDSGQVLTIVRGER